MICDSGKRLLKKRKKVRSADCDEERKSARYVFNYFKLSEMRWNQWRARACAWRHSRASVNPATIKMFGICSSVKVILALHSLVHSLALPSRSMNVQMEMFHSWKFLWNDRKKRTNVTTTAKAEKRQSGGERKGQRPKIIYCARYDERIRNWCVVFFCPEIFRPFDFGSLILRSLTFFFHLLFRERF